LYDADISRSWFKCRFDWWRNCYHESCL